MAVVGCGGKMETTILEQQFFKNFFLKEKQKTSALSSDCYSSNFATT